MLLVTSLALTLGALLTLTALLGAGVRRVSGPDGGGAGTAGETGEDGAAGRPRAGRAILRFILSPLDPASWEAAIAIVQGSVIGAIAFSLVIGIFSTGASLLVVGVGVVLVGLGIEVSRVVAGIERRRVTVTGSRPLHPHAYRSTQGGLREVAIGTFLDLNRWRDVAYVFVSFPLTALEFAVTVSLWVAALLLVTAWAWVDEVGAAIHFGPLQVVAGQPWFVVALAVVAGVVLLPAAASVSQALLGLHRAVVAGLLCESEERALQRRVETLEVSRRAVLDSEASELRRLERDLHDGAQQRLVVLAMGLGMAAEKVDSDPERAKVMVLEARDQARTALAELRDLVRGIAPSILMDRGLVAALESISARGPVPAVVLSELPPGLRLPDALERAAYFVAAESLANVAKHAAGAGAGGPNPASPPSSPEGSAAASPKGSAAPSPEGWTGRASRCEVRVRREDSDLIVEVWDDGPGGAVVMPGSGLAGLQGRVGALDGKLEVTSPAGGPTLVRAALPVPDWAVPQPPGPASWTPLADQGRG